MCWESHSKWKEWVHIYGVGIHPGDMVFWEQQEHQSITEQEIQVMSIY
jgi:hypothetical protein